MSSGTVANTPDSQLESDELQYEQTSYTNDYITSKFTKRDADDTVLETEYTVTGTFKPFEFQTAHKPDALLGTKDAKGDHLDHFVVIECVRAVNDSKQAAIDDL
ncbi:hypothetical protein L226DRAFT_569444 [Lentinus tigrinus ALCF2SS1-7]|uniref:uncharacterized protein n=1 Tax=Lentinus tigrinus ALCF2SS1-7 TaxID=1328758 RepID=UPI0011660D27|nr:hypothetical protein L226DRAFT_569444 [Lentinus tigrinus ALCF2SS1-7]